MNGALKEKIKQEKENLKSYFGREIEPTRLELPDSVLKKIKGKGLGLHFIPPFSYEDFPQQTLSPFFLRLQNEGELSLDSLKLNRGWVVVEKEPKPTKKRVWLYKNVFFDLLERTGLSTRKLGGLSPRMEFPGFNKFAERLGITRREIENKILPSINTNLCSSREKVKALCSSRELSVRLPTYLEYVYLGKSFYNDWGQTETWEWMRDRLKDGRFLAAGSKNASALGADGYDHWSTALSYRVIYEIENRKTK